MKLHPFHECAATANEQILKGNKIFQKWQCEHCGAEQHMEKPNHFWEKGLCEECSQVTNILQNGCNYLLMIEGGQHVLDYLERRIASDNRGFSDSLSNSPELPRDWLTEKP